MQKNIYSSLNTANSKCLMVIILAITLAGFVNRVQAQECYISPYPSPANFTAAGSAESVDIVRVGDCTLTIVSYPSWIFSVQNNGSYILIQAAQNTGAERSGSVWLDYGGNNYYVSLTQAGVPMPAITSQPPNQTKCENETASFSVTASNASSYQWYKSLNAGTYSIVTGATSSTYSFTVSAAMNNTRYQCIVSNVSGNVTSTGALLTVHSLTQVSNPTDVTTCINSGPVSFYISANGSGGLTFQWERSINGGAFVMLLINDGFEGINLPTLTVIDISANINAKFRCGVGSGCGYVTSNPATLLSVSTTITVSNPQNQLICPGEVATFSVSSSAALGFQWEEKTAASNEFTFIEGATSNIYQFTPTPDKAGAQYRCVVNGNCGSSETSQPATLQFHNLTVSITKHPVDITICDQEQAVISLEATPTDLLYQWQISTNGGLTFNEIPGATSPSYSFVSGISQNGNKYSAKLRHPLCNTFITSGSMILSVLANPVLAATINASATSVSIGEEVELTVTPNSPGSGETWRWYVLNNAYSLTIGSEGSIKVNPANTTTYYVNANSCNGNGKSITITSIERFSDENYIYTVQPKVPMDGTMALRTDENVNEEIQYFDGLGRTKQSIAIQGSPEGYDIVTPIVYDSLGREAKKFLPFVSGNSGFYQPTETILDSDYNYVGAAQNFYGGGKIAEDSRPFSETFFEASPLNRPYKEYGPGIEWAPPSVPGGNIFIQHNYLSNVHSLTDGGTAEAIIAWKVNEQDLPAKEDDVEDHIVDGGYYDSNQIYIKITLDERRNAIREYTNKQGQVILKKVQVVANSTNLNNVDQWACTYYIYDDMGNLRIVLPPEGVKQFLQVPAQN